MASVLELSKQALKSLVQLINLIMSHNRLLKHCQWSLEVGYGTEDLQLLATAESEKQYHYCN